MFRRPTFRSNRRGVAAGGILIPKPPASSKFVDYWISEAGVQEGAAPGQVGQWTSQIREVGLTAPASASEPLFIEDVLNGRPALRWDGTDDRLRVGSYDLSSFQDIDVWLVTVRSKTGSVQNAADFDGTARFIYLSDATDNPRFTVIGNAGTKTKFDSDTTLQNIWRQWHGRVQISQSDDVRLFYDKALTEVDSTGGTANNTDANLGTGEFTLGERATSAGSGNHYGGDMTFFGFADPTGDRAATAQWLKDTYGVP